MGLFSWIIIGISVGWVTNFFFKRRKKSVRACRILAGMAGAFTGGILSNVFYFGEPININFTWPSFFIALFCAILLVLFSFYETRHREFSY